MKQRVAPFVHLESKRTYTLLLLLLLFFVHSPFPTRASYSRTLSIVRGKPSIKYTGWFEKSKLLSPAGGDDAAALEDDGDVVADGAADEDCDAEGDGTVTMVGVGNAPPVVSSFCRMMPAVM